MKVQCLNSDIISTLHQNIIEAILCVLPIRDTVRTSILSRKWRYSGTSIPALHFDDELFHASSIRRPNDLQEKKHKLFNAIFQVLLVHRGPLLHFSLKFGELNMISEIDPIILHLSKSNTLKSFDLDNKLGNQYKILSVLSSFQLLEELSLASCAFELSLTFNGLGLLRNLGLYNVQITAKTLQRLLINCSLLEKVILCGCPPDFGEGIKFTFVELLKCLPLLMQLEIYDYYVEYLVVGGMPPKLSTSLVHLKIIILDVCLTNQDDLSSLLCIIRSSPNLEKIDLMMFDDVALVEQSFMNFFDLEDYSSYKLNHFKDLKIHGFKNLPVQMEFVKFIMAKSPVLNKVQISLHLSVSVDEELMILREVIRDPIPRVSPSAKLIFQR